jgi:azurin
MLRIRILICLGLALVGCGTSNASAANGGGEPVPHADTTSTLPGTLPPSAAAPAAQLPGTPSPQPLDPPNAANGGASVEVHIIVSANGMTYDVTKISATAGQPVHVVLENKAPGVLAHNFVLVRPGTEAAVAAAGLSQGLAAGYLAEGPDVLAHSEMVQPGKTVELRFIAPHEPGKYPYICTFPGHYMMMKGVLEVMP